jgi:predicted nucleic acid-binding protein
MILADSSVWISLFRNDNLDEVEKLRSFIPRGLILVGDVILLEVLQGARDHQAKFIARQLAEFPAASMISPSLAIKAAANYRMLRSRGITIRTTIDIIIGTYCIEHGHSLLHADRDFTPMAEHLGLRIA